MKSIIAIRGNPRPKRDNNWYTFAEQLVRVEGTREVQKSAIARIALGGEVAELLNVLGGGILCRGALSGGAVSGTFAGHAVASGSRNG